MKGELRVELIKDGKDKVLYKKELEPYFTWNEDKPGLYVCSNCTGGVFISLNIPVEEVVKELFNDKAK